MTNKTIILTGCCGLIGSAILKKALKDGHRVLGIDKLTYVSDNQYTEKLLQNLKHSYSDKFEFLKKDINDLTHLPDCDWLIHCAAESHVDNSVYGQNEFLKTNVLGLEHLLQLIRAKPKFNRPIVLSFSTDEVYGDDPPESGFDENAPLKPSSPYSATKCSADMLLIGYAKTFDLQYFIVRPSNAFGIGQYPEKLISKNLRHLDRGEKVIVYGANTNYSRTWIASTDISNAVFKILTNGTINNIYNISGDLILENREVLRILVGAYLDRPDITMSEFLKDYAMIVPNRPGEDKIYKVNDRKLRTLGWTPRELDFDQKIMELVTHYKNNIQNWF